VSSFKPNSILPLDNLPPFNNVWIQVSYLGLFNCKPFYDYGSVDGYTIKSEAYLTRIDDKGNILWTKQYDECLGKGNSIIRNSVGCLSMVTMKLKGRVPIPVYNQNGIFQDTVNYPEDDNTVCFYIIGKDGNTLLRREIGNVFNRGYSEISIPVDIQEMSSNYVIKTEKNTIILSNTGIVVSRYTNHEAHCNNKNNSMCSHGNTLLVSGYHVTLDTFLLSIRYYHYIQRLSSAVSVLWEIETDDALKDVYADRFVTISSDFRRLKMYSITGSKLWSLTNPGTGVVKINCSKGVTMAKMVGGQLSITRTNSAGEY